MKYFQVLALSAMLFLGLISPSIGVNFWQKLLYNQEDTKEQKKKDFKISIILWAIGTIAMFVFAIIFGKQ
ncbi:MAG: hypothetical protein LBT22_02815 [Peptococcaceae bacterium]|nr:hypothetical protein [Peptococcaceae bacterium]